MLVRMRRRSKGLDKQYKQIANERIRILFSLAKKEIKKNPKRPSRSHKKSAGKQPVDEKDSL